MTHRKITFGSELKALLDMLELSIEELEKSSVEKVSKESSFMYDLDWKLLFFLKNQQFIT